MDQSAEEKATQCRSGSLINMDQSAEEKATQ